ncbi:hypothetical protein SB5439_05136 [Klebsiella variicola]|nr:hypothetical protein SB5439_05136 [Klebsiella variicola]
MMFAKACKVIFVWLMVIAAGTSVSLLASLIAAH